MPYDVQLLFIDLGIIGSITTLIVALSVWLGRKEDRREESAVAVAESLRQAG